MKKLRPSFSASTDWRVGGQAAVARSVTADRDLDARGEIVLPESAPQQLRRAAGLERPVLDRAVRALHVDMDPAVRVDPLHLGEHTLQSDRLLDVEFRRERVMRPRRSLR